MRKFILLSVVSLSLLLANCQEKNKIAIPIVTGAERIDNYLSLVKDKQTGLVINQSSVVGKTNLLDTLTSLGIRVKTIFSPEHGFSGTKDPGEHIKNEKDSSTGIRIISLYGKKYKPCL